MLLFSIIMDTTQDISKEDQCSHVYRYVFIERNDKDIAVDILIMEASWGFDETVDTSAAALEKKILDNIASNGFDLAKCQGIFDTLVWSLFGRLLHRLIRILTTSAADGSLRCGCLFPIHAFSLILR